MAILNYLLYYLIILPLSHLPFRVLYFISDILYVVIFRLFGYRKKVVKANLEKSFPDKSRTERDDIMRRFYRHLSDLVVESLAIFTITREEVHQRMKYNSVTSIQKFYDDNRSIIIAGGHFNNWELFAVAIDDDIPHQAIGIYSTLSNPFFNKKMKISRCKYGLDLVSTKDITNQLSMRTDELTAPIFAIDQSPGNALRCYWLRFLHQDTAVAFGTEKTTNKYNYPVYYCRINKLKRGFYQYELILVSDNPQDNPHGYITEKLTQLLEQDIIWKPEYWLWSHRRWKHTKPADVDLEIFSTNNEAMQGHQPK